MHVPRYVLWILIVAAPLSLLILFPHATFNLDWNNSVWMVSYARAAFTDHLRFPAVYNVSDRVGIPQPIFYGPLLYPKVIRGIAGRMRAAQLCFCMFHCAGILPNLERYEYPR
jgi:hypothetical protein